MTKLIRDCGKVVGHRIDVNILQDLVKVKIDIYLTTLKTVDKISIQMSMSNLASF